MLGAANIALGVGRLVTTYVHARKILKILLDPLYEFVYVIS